MPDYPHTGNLRYDYCYHEDTKLRWGGLQIAAREQYAQILVNRILALCKSRGISVNKLSELSGVSQSTLDNLVNGKTFNPRICTLHRIALAFGMTVSELLDFKDLNDFSFEDMRVVAPQAADELLSIDEVDASFVLYETSGVINISARSMGLINVQLIMENMGGGGHQTMAATQLRGVEMEKAKQLLFESIDDYYTTHT